ncbi:MAG: ABC transporter ATP-binding protein [Candidatus Atribacteria bacterium]|nr:ABC transporter ATP-binding protein [Candidatus Atribacteria bacterium]
MKKMIELSNVSKSFHSLKVIKKLNINVKEGEVVSLVGPSGCGKTTTLRMIAGLERSEGQIKRDFNHPAFIFQEPRLLPWKTVLDNILFVLFDRISSQDKMVKIATYYLKLMAIDQFGGYYPAQLSGGMRKRVAIARALAIEPDLILMDEPFSDIDFPLRLLIIDHLDEILKKEGKTVLYVTHDIREALLVSHRLYILTNKPMQVKEELFIQRNLRKRGIENSDFHELEKHVIEILKEESLKEFFKE